MRGFDGFLLPHVPLERNSPFPPPLGACLPVLVLPPPPDPMLLRVSEPSRAATLVFGGS